MTATEVTLIIIGLIFIVGSFIIRDVFSSRDLEKMAKLGEKDLNKIMEHQIKKAENEIQESIGRISAEKQDDVTRTFERQTNEKIMAISEFSDSVLDSMHKTHDENMFLYSMLNDKHEELVQLAGELDRFSGKLKEWETQVSEKIEQLEQARREQEDREQSPAGMPSDNAPQSASAGQIVQEERSNARILELYREGMPDVEIAKVLGRGLGEIRLVLGLYRREN